MELLTGGPMGFIVAIVVAVLLVAGLIVTRLKIVSPNEALIVSGSRKDGAVKVVPPGGKVFVVPVIQSSSSLSLEAYQIPITIDCVDKNTIPVDIEAVAMVKVGAQDQYIRAAAERFVGREKSMPHSVSEVLSGTVRSTAGKLTVQELISDRDTFSASVAEAAENDLEKMGIIVDTLQIKDISDRQGYIEALGQPETQRVIREARVAKAQNEAIANQSEAESQRKIAEQNKELEVYRAKMMEETMKAKAVSDASEPIARAEQERLIVLREQEVAEQRAVLKERQLDTEVRKPADAERYRLETEAEAKKRAAVLEAEAQAETVRTRGIADAEARRSVGLAEAEANKAIGLAEAEAMDAKAEALAKYGEAAIIEILAKIMPEVAREIAKGYEGIDKMTVISTDGATALTKGVTDNFEQIREVINTTIGVDLSQLASGFTAPKLAE